MQTIKKKEILELPVIIQTNVDISNTDVSNVDRLSRSDFCYLSNNDWIELNFTYLPNHNKMPQGDLFCKVKHLK